MSEASQVLKATLVQKVCVSHSSNLHINRLQASTFHLHFECEAVNTCSLLMLRKEFPWMNEVVASEVLHSLPRVAFISNPHLAYISQPKRLVASEIYHSQLV
jgi:hypothetical protein